MTGKRLTPAQYRALSKWRDGKPENERALKVREDIYWKLRGFGFIQSAGFMQKRITEAGLAALKDYEGSLK